MTRDSHHSPVEQRMRTCEEERHDQLGGGEIIAVSPDSPTKSGQRRTDQDSASALVVEFWTWKPSWPDHPGFFRIHLHSSVLSVLE